MNYIQKIVEDFDFSLIQNDNKASSFAENVLGLVNLGLPSGLLWCDCNLGANTETEYSDYYAWGELTTKNEYTKDTEVFDLHNAIFKTYDDYLKIRNYKKQIVTITYTSKNSTSYIKLETPKNEI